MPKGKTGEPKPKKKIVLKKESMPTTVKKTVQPPKKRINIKKTKPVKKPKKKSTKCVDVGCPNRDNIIRNFKILLSVVDLSGDKHGSFKKRQYNRVIEVISSSEDEIENIDMAIELFKQAGMKNPKKTIEKVTEILTTGSLKSVEKALKNPKTLALQQLTDVYAIGPKNALALYEKHGIVTIDELKAAVDENPGILNAKQLLGMKYHDDLSQRIPRAEIDQFNTICASIVADMNAETGSESAYDFSINGSYRRGNATSGDIDLMLKTLPGAPKGSGLLKMVKALYDKGFIVDILAYKDEWCLSGSDGKKRKKPRKMNSKKFMGVLNFLGEGATCRHLDIIETTPKEWPFAKLYFTGSGGFNVKMRKHALDMGYTMNEYGLKKKGAKTDVSTSEIKSKIGKDAFETERDIFDFLDYTYYEPSKRRGFTLSKLKYKAL